MFCFAALADQNDNTIYRDLAGKFPVRSYSGMNYLFIAYIYGEISESELRRCTDIVQISFLDDLKSFIIASSCDYCDEKELKLRKYVKNFSNRRRGGDS